MENFFSKFFLSLGDPGDWGIVDKKNHFFLSPGTCGNVKKFFFFKKFSKSRGPIVEFFFSIFFLSLREWGIVDKKFQKKKF